MVLKLEHMNIKIHHYDVPKKRGFFSWAVLKKKSEQKWQKLPDVAHGDDVMVWHTSAQ